MTIITMPREMGTRGKDVARLVGEHLGIEVVHHELIARGLAEKMDLPPSNVLRFLEGGGSLLDKWKIDRTKLARFTAEELLDLARRGNVLIRGWGGAQLIGGISHVMSVRVCAPMAFRVAVLRDRLGLPNDHAARREIEHNDEMHSQLVRARFGQDWRDPLNYDIVLNSATLSVQRCADLIVQLAADERFRETDASRQELEDQIIDSKVRALIREVEGAQTTLVGLEISVREGVVALGGTVISRGDADKLIAKIRALDQVKSVRSEITVIEPYFAAQLWNAPADRTRR